MTDADRPHRGLTRRDDGSLFARLWGLLGLATRRTLTRALRTERIQTGLSVAGVGVAVGLLLLVTSIGIGLSESATIRTSDADYAIVPAGESSAITNVDRARFGRTHAVATRLSAREDVVHATPILASFLATSVPDSESEGRRLLVIGVVPAPEGGVIAGLSTEGLEPGDPHYADGSYDGPWTGEVLLSEAGADALGAGRGTVVRFGRSNRSFRVANVTVARSAGVGQLPVALVHLSELQAITGGAANDVADQILVRGTGSLSKAALSNVYPRSTVVSRTDLFAGSESRLPIAIAIAAFIVAVVVGTLFMVTTMGFELAADRPRRAVMRAIGVSGTSRTLVVVFQVFVVAALGGLLGVGLWLVGVPATNALAREFLGASVAAFRPVLAVYGIGVALLIGLLTVPYLLLTAWRGRDRLTPGTT